MSGDLQTRQRRKEKRKQKRGMDTFWVDKEISFEKVGKRVKK